ncbi:MULTISPECIES: TRAP transporter small permease [unclassified Avibacterium]|uniref:TRAP transporter small permease n=1 Tax=unclassified Avibacterium TaxID=2685287 RepID=UPI002188B24C|nr:TRAP transporter small permease [Avibacterium sp. 20-129]MCW9698511.1 TRAP transporter small permease [Avibacterium sp. 20-129]URL02601.1 TRAP transporter small permease [Avibacterium sp. 20-126]
MLHCLFVVKRFLDKLIEWVCIFIVGAMTILITYQVISRYIFNSPSAVSEILSRYFFVWLILFASAYVFGKREHMEINFLKNKLPSSLKRLANVIAEIALSCFAIGVMIIGGYSASVRQMFQLDSALQIPMGFIYSAIPISGAIIVFYSLCNILSFYQSGKE